MKYIKTFEELKPDPEIGDYVIQKSQHSPINYYLSTHIGKIVHIEPDRNTTYYVAQYSNVPEDLFDYFNVLEDFPTSRLLTRDEILEYSKDIEYLEYMIKANKYNL